MRLVLGEGKRETIARDSATTLTAQIAPIPPGLAVTSGQKALDEFDVRYEPALGTPSCTDEDFADQVER